MKTCPCGTGKPYQDCCGLYIELKKIPETPEALMRSRYTAYAQSNMEYIRDTMKGKASENFNVDEAYDFNKQIEWLRLTVISASSLEDQKDIAYVEFIATYYHNNKEYQLHEVSKFQRENDRWFYTDKMPLKPKTSEKIGRNDPCPCGSGKKYKKCCQA